MKILRTTPLSMNAWRLAALFALLIGVLMFTPPPPRFRSSIRAR